MDQREWIEKGNGAEPGTILKGGKTARGDLRTRGSCPRPGSSISSYSITYATRGVAEGAGCFHPDRHKIPLYRSPLFHPTFRSDAHRRSLESQDLRRLRHC